MSTVSTVVNEVTITGRVYRRLIDKAAKLWQRISYWTHASDVEFDDGKTAQEKLGNINGITSDFEMGAFDIAASSLLTKRIKDDLNEGIINDRIQLVIQNDGTLGWKKDGADTVIPFSNTGKINIQVIPTNYTVNSAPRDYKYYVLFDDLRDIANQPIRKTVQINDVNVGDTGVIKKGDKVKIDLWGKWSCAIILCSL